MSALKEMLEPKQAVHSDEDGFREDESSQIWSCLGGLVIVIALGIALLAPAAKAKIQAARVEAQWQADMDHEKREFQALIRRMQHGTPEERRLAREIIAEMEKGGRR